MGDTCCFPFSMGHIKRLIEAQLPGIYVYSVMVGNDIIEDEIHGFLGNVNSQIQQVAGKLAGDPNLARGFNAVGFSQVPH
jgi:palmitoyl-protein thioesterase